MSATDHPIAKGLHGLMAQCIVGLMAVGLIMKDLPLSPEKIQRYSWHTWAGVSEFVLVWRMPAMRSCMCSWSSYHSVAG